MSWDGTINRRVVYATPTSSTSCLVGLSCQHEQPSNLSADRLIRSFREIPCAECSKPSWERISKIREAINFEDVLEKLRRL